MIGDGVERVRSERLARSLGVGGAVEMTGWLPNAQVIEKLEQADIGVAPYLKLEPFFFDPAKILEYMASGLAIVASEQGRVSEMLEHGECLTSAPLGQIEVIA